MMNGYFKYSIIVSSLCLNLFANNGINIITPENNATSSISVEKNSSTPNENKIAASTQLIKEDNTKRASFAIDNILKKTSFNFIEEFFQKFGYENIEVLQIKKVAGDLNEILVKINDKQETLFQNKNGFIMNNQFISYEEIMKKLQEQDVINLKNKLTSMIFTTYKEFLYVPFAPKADKPELLVIVPFKDKNNISFEKLKEISDKSFNISILYISDVQDDQKCIIDTQCMEMKNFYLQGNTKKDELFQKYNNLIKDYKNLLDLPSNILFLKN